jgi:hypothetical protein
MKRGRDGRPTDRQRKKDESERGKINRVGKIEQATQIKYKHTTQRERRKEGQKGRKNRESKREVKVKHRDS